MNSQRPAADARESRSSSPGVGRRRRPWLSAAAGAAGVALLATGCVGQGGAAEEPASGDGVTDGASPAAAELPPSDVETTLDIWSYMEPSNVSAWWTDGVAKFNEEYPNVDVEHTMIPYANFPAKVLGSGISDSVPDGVYFNPTDGAKLYEAGVLADFTSIWADYADKDQFPESVVWEHDGDVISVQGIINTTALTYNKDILDEVGLAVPTTIEEFDAALKAVHDAGHQGFLLGARPDGSGEFDFFPWLLAYGQNYGEWDKAKVQEVFEYFGRWLDAGYIPRDITGLNENDNHNKFATGDYAFVQSGNWNLGRAAEEFPFEWGVTSLPAGPDGSHSVGGGEGFAIGEGTEYPALVFEFFRTVILDADQEVAALGEQGRLPARADASSTPLAQDDPNIAAYMDVVQEMGSRPSSPLMSDYLIEMGKVWNAFAGGSIDAPTAADRVIQNMSEL